MRVLCDSAVLDLDFFCSFKLVLRSAMANQNTINVKVALNFDAGGRSPEGSDPVATASESEEKTDSARNRSSADDGPPERHDGFLRSEIERLRHELDVSRKHAQTLSEQVEHKKVELVCARNTIDDLTASLAQEQATRLAAEATLNAGRGQLLGSLRVWRSQSSGIRFHLEKGCHSAVHPLTLCLECADRASIDVTD